jgi:hypothetical protein
MSGFRKAAPKQAAVKMSIYGPAGSGKTFSTLLFAEGLAIATGKRIAFVDTERGSDFYAMAVPEREAHPAAFDFDALYTRSLTETLREVRALNPAEHGIVVLDSISHLWDAAVAAYSGHKTGGKIPMHAWGAIKQPYKALISFLMDSPYHVFILGRQANVFEEDDEGDVKAAGVKMRAEGETAYEPNFCLRMIPKRFDKEGKKIKVHKESVITAFVEKDRSGVLSGKSFEWPTFDTVIKPLLGLFNGEQAALPSQEEAATQDIEAMTQEARQKVQESAALALQFRAKFDLAEDATTLKELGKELTPAVKKRFTPADLEAVRNHYGARDTLLKGRSNGNQSPTEA